MSWALRLRYVLHPPAWNELQGIEEVFWGKWTNLALFYTTHPALYVVLSWLPLMAFALYFNYVINEARIFPKKNLLPAFVWILYTSFIPSWTIFSMPFVSNVFIWIAFGVGMKLYNAPQPQKQIFNMGCWSALAALFHMPSLIAILFFVAVLLILRPFKTKELVALVIGWLTPIYFVGVYYSVKKFINHAPISINMDLHLPLKTISTSIFILLSILSLALLMYGLFLVNQSQGKNTTAVRKKWNSIGFYVFFAVMAGIFSSTFPGISWIIVCTPTSIVLLQTLHNHTEKFNTFTFYFLLLVVFITQWVLQPKFGL